MKTAEEINNEAYQFIKDRSRGIISLSLSQREIIANWMTEFTLSQQPLSGEGMTAEEIMTMVANEHSYESEREKIEKALVEIGRQWRINFIPSWGDKALKDFVDFILSRDKEKDAEIEMLKEYYENKWEVLYRNFSNSEAENERLKGEREKDAIGFADFLLSDYEMDNRGDELVWKLCGTEQKITTNEAYTEYKAYAEYLNSNNK